MTTAKEIKAKIRAQAAEELQRREEAATKTATALTQVERAQSALAAAEQAAADRIRAAADVLGMTNLAELLDHKPAALKALTARYPATTKPADNPTQNGTA